MMKEMKYIIIDNLRYAEYFIRELKNQYTPITTDICLKSFFEAKGVKSIWILDYLSKLEIEKVTLDISSMTDFFIDELDKSNSVLYKRLFGERKIRFFYSTMKYLFKRFLISSLQFVKGLESIVENNNITELTYLHDDSVNLLDRNLQYNAFFFPDDIIWKLTQCWNYDKKPKMVFLRISADNPLLVEPKRPNFLEIIKDSLRPTKRFFEKLIRYPYRYLYRYSSSKKTLLLLSPLCELSFMPFSLRINKEYNIIKWSVDYDILPEFFDNYPTHVFFKYNKEEQISDINCEQTIDDFNLMIKDLEQFTEIKDFDFSSFITPLIKDFLKKGLFNIMCYWRSIKRIHRKIKIDLLFWGIPPHRYPAGIVREFCRLKEIPIVGMQHGGGYGSNFAGRTNFDLDFEKCNFWFSYGFNTNDLKKIYPNENSYPEIIPVGSVRIFKLAAALKSIHRQKIKAKILYPMDFFQNFFRKTELGIPQNELFNFQKQIVDLLLPYANKYRVTLKFIIGSNYVEQPLKIYLDSLSSHDFKIIEDLSYQTVLNKYEADIILLDNCSTPLNESLVTSSNIIVYNNQDKSPLTQDAANLLSKRACVCNSKDAFLNQLEKCLNGSAIEKDLGNREFLEKYCVYKEDPKENIAKAIANITEAANARGIKCQQ